MVKELGSYELSDSSSKQELKGISGTREGNKNYIDFNGIGPAYAEQLDRTGPNNQTLFHGWADAGSSTASAVWRIKKFIYSGSRLSSTQWADGNGEFDNIFNNRASLDYS